MQARLALSVWMLLFAGCSSSEWVHPSKPKDEFAQDYNKCQGQALQDPKYQQGNNYFLLRATEQCVTRNGWVLREKVQQ
jgi:hypothetical protein